MELTSRMLLTCNRTVSDLSLLIKRVQIVTDLCVSFYLSMIEGSLQVTQAHHGESEVPQDRL